MAGCQNQVIFTGQYNWEQHCQNDPTSKKHDLFPFSDFENTEKPSSY